MPDGSNMTPEIDISQAVPVGEAKKPGPPKRPRHQAPFNPNKYKDILEAKEPSHSESEFEKMQEEMLDQASSRSEFNKKRKEALAKNPFVAGDGGGNGPDSGRYEQEFQSRRSFSQIQKRLKELADLDYVYPNDGEVLAIQAERELLLGEAEKIGLFKNLRTKIADIQNQIGEDGIYTYDEAMDKVEDLDTDKDQEIIKRTITAKDKNAWNPLLEGELEAYKDVAVLVMRQAQEEALSKFAKSQQERDAAGKRAEDLDRKVAILSWGSVPESIKSKAAREVRGQVNPQSRTSPGRNEIYEGMKRFYAEREPSVEVALEEFERTERLCEFYKAEDFKLIMDKIKNTKERKIFETRFKIFQVALVKRFQGGGTMSGVSENTILKTISAEEIIGLFESMPGYLEAMQEIANVLKNRRNIGRLNYSLVDCKNQTQFEEAAMEFDAIITDRLITERGTSPDEAKRAAYIAFNTAINTMYGFNVPEFYNSAWKGNTRNKSIECVNTAPRDEKGILQTGPTFYDRIVSKPIYDSFCPIDDLITEALKPEKKKPSKNNITKWAITQMTKQGLIKNLVGLKVEKTTDFDKVVVLRGGPLDRGRNFWKVVINPRGERILFVPPIRPIKIGGSILDVNKINIISGGERKQKTFMEALADRNEIDYKDPGIAANFCSTYTLTAKDLDTIKDAFRDKKTLKDWPEIKNALGSYDLGNNMELIAWMYVDLADAIDPNNRYPKLLKPTIFATRYARESMGLPRSDKFNILRFINQLKTKEYIKNKIKELVR